MSGFALLGLAICFFLPFGAIGAIDASFTSSVAVPHQRTNTQHQARPVTERSARSESAHLRPPQRIDLGSSLHLSTFRRILSTPAPVLVGLLLALVVLYLLSGAGVRTSARTTVLARPPSRGPPFPC